MLPSITVVPHQPLQLSAVFWRCVRRGRCWQSPLSLQRLSRSVSTGVCVAVVVASSRCRCGVDNRLPPVSDFREVTAVRGG